MPKPKEMRFFAVIILMFTLCRTACAEDVTIPGEEVYNKAVLDITSGEMNLNPVNIINSFFKEAFSEITEAKGLLKSILLASVAAGLLRIVSESQGGEAADAAGLACFVLMTGISVEIFGEAVGTGAEIIHTLCGFVTKFEPIFIGLLASCGAIAQAAAFQPVLTASVYILSLLIDKCILPMIYFSAVLGIVNNISTRVEIGTLNKLLQSAAKWMLTGVLTLFSSILAVYGFGTSAMNTVTLKGIKFAVGSFVPVVGGILSDTVDTVLSGTGLLKNAVGTAGMTALVAAAAAPAVKIWIMMILLKITAAAVEPFSDKRITNILISVSEALGTLFSTVIATVMLFVISIGIILMSTGVSL